MRFAAMQDPSNDWLVYDLNSERPVEMGERPLVGLTQSEAEQLAAQANAMVGGQTIPSPAPFATVASNMPARLLIEEFREKCQAVFAGKGA